MSFCKYYGTEIKYGAKFCVGCGNSLENNEPNKNITSIKEVNMPQKIDKPEKPHKKGRLEFILIGVLIALVLVAGILAVKIFIMDKSDSNDNKTASTSSSIDLSFYNIDLSNYPQITLELKKDSDKRLIKEDLKLSEDNEQIGDFEITNGDKVIYIKYTTPNTNNENNEISIEIKYNEEFNSSVRSTYSYRNEKEGKDDYEELKNNVNSVVRDSFNMVAGIYAYAFKDVTEDTSLVVNSNKTIAGGMIDLFVMIEAYDKIKDGTINEQDKITLTDSMKVQGSGELHKSKAGTKITVSQLIDMMMSDSDNTATNILIDMLGKDDINAKIKKIGCIDTELNRKMMDEKAVKDGIENYTSVNDLLMVLSKIYKGQCIDSTYDSKMIDKLKTNTTKNKISGKLPSSVEVAERTGEYKDFQNDAAIIYTDKGAYILCITTSKGKEEQQINAISSASKKVYDIFTK